MFNIGIFLGTFAGAFAANVIYGIIRDKRGR